MSIFNISTVPNSQQAMIKRTFDMLAGIEDQNDVYGCDLHHHLFNEDYAFIYTADAQKACEEIGVFDCIDLVNSYEKFNFGELYTDINPFSIANMIVYILGQELLAKSSHLNYECWDRRLTSEDIQIIIDELNDDFEKWGDLDLFNIAYQNYH